MIVSEPWTAGWMKRAVPVLQVTILTLTLATVAAATVSAATIERQWDVDALRFFGETGRPAASYASDHTLYVRLELLFFYSLTPLILLAVASVETWCLYNNDLAPNYIVFGSVVWIFAWGLEIALWTACGTTTGDNVPSFCPVDFHEGKGVLFNLSGLDSAKGATAGAGLLILLYLIYIFFGLLEMRRLKKVVILRRWAHAPMHQRRRSGRYSYDVLAPRKKMPPIAESDESSIEAQSPSPR